jgi:hypothetical protein
MTTNLDKLTPLALDLSKAFPRSPRETLGGYVVAARALDKCRAVLAGTDDGYIYNCPLDKLFFTFTGIDAEAFKALVATGASDAEVADWITAHATPRERIAIIHWNNSLRDKRISELPDALQTYLEDYIPTILKPGKNVYVWFDVYDIEEGRL